MRKQRTLLEKEIMQGTMPVQAGEKDHARPGWTTSRFKTWTGLLVEESIRMTEDRDK